MEVGGDISAQQKPLLREVAEAKQRILQPEGAPSPEGTSEGAPTRPLRRGTDRSFPARVRPGGDRSPERRRGLRVASRARIPVRGLGCTRDASTRGEPGVAGDGAARGAGLRCRCHPSPSPLRRTASAARRDGPRGCARLKAGATLRCRPRRGQARSEARELATKAVMLRSRRSSRGRAGLSKRASQLRRFGDAGTLHPPSEALRQAAAPSPGLGRKGGGAKARWGSPAPRGVAA